MQTWRSRKISHDTAKKDLVRSRDPGLIRMLTVVDMVRKDEERLALQLEVAERLKRLEMSLGEFVDSDVCFEFQRQFRTMLRPLFRFKTCLFLGLSRAGKTYKAMSMWGMKRSFVVNCQGLDTAIPSLQAFTKVEYDVIIYDEVTEKQVLNNKLLFQSGPKLITLGQSPCGAFAYTRDFYAVPMILCSNQFKLTVSEGLTTEEAEWLSKNIMVADLPAGSKTWYVPNGSDES